MTVISRNLHHFLNLFLGDLDARQVLFQDVLEAEENDVLELAAARFKVRIAVRRFWRVLFTVLFFLHKHCFLEVIFNRLRQ